MTEKEMEKEEYAEQKWEMKANGIKPPSFKVWKAKRAMWAKFYEDKKKEEERHA